MSDDVLATLIGDLRAAIDNNDSIVGDEEVGLMALVARVESRIADEHGGLVEQIEDAVSRFETDHVALAGTLNRVANVLSAGGI